MPKAITYKNQAERIRYKKAADYQILCCNCNRIKEVERANAKDYKL